MSSPIARTKSTHTQNNQPSSPLAFQKKNKNIFKDAVFQRENNTVFEIAKALLHPDGTLNKEALTSVKNLFQYHGNSDSPFDNHQLIVLDNLNNPAVQAAFEKIGKVNEVGNQIVRTTLCLPDDTVTTSYHARRVALASFLGRLRHLEYNSCYSYAVSMAVKTLAPFMVFEEYNDILQHGALKRHLDGREYTFLAAPKMTRAVLDKELTAKTTSKELWEHPHLVQAFGVIGASKQTVDSAIREIQREKLTLTLQGIFDALKAKLPPISKELWKKAFFTAAALVEMPLSRIWNNAIASMFFTPFTTNYKQISTHDIFKISILRTLITFVEQSKDPKAKSCLAELSKDIPRLSLARLEGEDFSDLLSHYYALDSETSSLSLAERTKRIQKDKVLCKRYPKDPVGLFNTLHYIVEDVPKCAISLTAPYFAPLDALRFFVEPPEALHKTFGECHLYKQEGETLLKITTQDEFGAALKEILIKIVRNMGVDTALSKVSSFSGTQIAGTFQSFFKPLLSCDGSGAYDSLYDNTPWSFKIAPSYFDSFWPICFRAQKIAMPTKTILVSTIAGFARDLLEWAEKARKRLGNSPKVLIPAKYPGKTPVSVYPGHAFVLTPNHPTMIPKSGQTIESMLQEKMEKARALTVKSGLNTIQEAKNWAHEYITTALNGKKLPNEITAIITAFQNEMALLEKNSSLKLERYLSIFVAKVAAATNQLKLQDFVIDELSNFCLQGLFSDIPGSEQSAVIHFGDSMYEHALPKAKGSIPVNACLYPNLVTNTWNTLYLAATKTYNFVKQFRFNELVIYDSIS